MSALKGRISLAVLVLFSLQHSTFAQGSHTESMNRPRQAVALSAQGGISLGNYQAGFLWATIAFMKKSNHDASLLHDYVGLVDTTWLQPHLRQGLDLPVFNMELVAGASAGNINSILTAIQWCQHGEIASHPTRNPFFDLWTNIGWEQLAHPDNQIDALFSTRYIEDVLFDEVLVSRYLNRDFFVPGCKVPVGTSLTRVKPARSMFQGIPIDVQRFVSLYQAQSIFDRDQDRLGRMVFRQHPLFSENDTTDLRTIGKIAALPLPAIQENEQIPLDSEYQNQLRIRDLTLASAAFPLAFKQQRLEHCDPDELESNLCQSPAESLLFADGGVFDNNPLDLAFNLLSYNSRQRLKTWQQLRKDALNLDARRADSIRTYERRRIALESRRNLGIQLAKQLTQIETADSLLLEDIRLNTNRLRRLEQDRDNLQLEIRDIASRLPLMEDTLNAFREHAFDLQTQVQAVAEQEPDTTLAASDTLDFMIEDIEAVRERYRQAHSQIENLTARLEGQLVSILTLQIHLDSLYQYQDSHLQYFQELSEKSQSVSLEQVEQELDNLESRHHAVLREMDRQNSSLEDRFDDIPWFPERPAGLRDTKPDSALLDPAVLFVDPGSRRLTQSMGERTDVPYEARYGVGAFERMIRGFIPAARKYELYAFDRNIRKLEGGPEQLRWIRESDRFLPIMGEHLIAFAGFLGKPFREFDYHVGIYDAAFFIARTFLCNSDEPVDYGESGTQETCALHFLLPVLKQLYPEGPARQMYQTLFLKECEVRAMPQDWCTQQWTGAGIGERPTMHHQDASDADRHVEVFAGLTSVNIAVLEQGNTDFFGLLNELSDSMKTKMKIEYDENCDARIFSSSPCFLDRSFVKLLEDPGERMTFMLDELMKRMSEVESTEQSYRQETCEADCDSALLSQRIVEGLDALYWSVRALNMRGFRFAPGSIPPGANWKWYLLPYAMDLGVFQHSIDLNYRPTYNGEKLSIFASTTPVGYLRQNKAQIFSSIGVGLKWNALDFRVRYAHKWKNTEDDLVDGAMSLEAGLFFFYEKFRLALRWYPKHEDKPFDRDPLMVTIGVADLNGFFRVLF